MDGRYFDDVIVRFLGDFHAFCANNNDFATARFDLHHVADHLAQKVGIRRQKYAWALFVN